MRITYQTLGVIIIGLSLGACAPYPVKPVPVSGTVVIKSRPIVRHQPRVVVKPRRIYPIRPRPILRKNLRNRINPCLARGIKPKYCYSRR